MSAAAPSLSFFASPSFFLSLSSATSTLSFLSLFSLSLFGSTAGLASSIFLAASSRSFLSASASFCSAVFSLLRNPGHTKAPTPHRPALTRKPPPKSTRRMIRIMLPPDFLAAFFFALGRSSSSSSSSARRFLTPVLETLVLAFCLAFRLGLVWMRDPSSSSSSNSGTNGLPHAGHLIFLPSAGRLPVRRTLSHLGQEKVKDLTLAMPAPGEKVREGYARSVEASLATHEDKKPVKNARGRPP